MKAIDWAFTTGTIPPMVEIMLLKKPCQIFFITLLPHSDNFNVETFEKSILNMERDIS